MRTATKTVLFVATSAALLFGVAQAYAGDNVLVSDDGQSRMWVYDKAAPQVSDPDQVSDLNPIADLDTPTWLLRRVDPLPTLVVPLNTTAHIRAQSVRELGSRADYSQPDLSAFDLVPDSPLFVGGQSSEFDTLDAQRARAGYDRTLGIDPLVPVAGAGLLTEF